MFRDVLVELKSSEIMAFGVFGHSSGSEIKFDKQVPEFFCGGAKEN